MAHEAPGATPKVTSIFQSVLLAFNEPEVQVPRVAKGSGLL
jgi:hypothetical protein